MKIDIEHLLLVIDLEGEPIPQKRPVVTRSCTYNPQADLKKRVAWTMRALALNQMEGMTLDEKFEGDLSYEVAMHFSFIVPPSYSKKKREKCLSEGMHFQKPDIDNLAKFYLDCGNGVLWSDDSKISKLTLCKEYGLQDKTTITVMSRGKYGR